MRIYKFVKWDVKPAMTDYNFDKFVKNYDKTCGAVSNALNNGCLKLGGWCYDFTDELRKFLIKQHGQWRQVYAPNKTAIRRAIYGRIDKIVEIDVNIERRAQKTLLKALKNTLYSPDFTIKSNIKAIINFVEFGCQND